MNQQTRSLLAGVLSLLVFFLWYQFYAKKMISPPAPTSVTQNSALPQGVLAQASSELPGSGLPDPGLPKGEEKLVVLENTLFSVTFSSYGGRIKGFLLKNFHEQATQKSPQVDLLPQPGDEMARVFCRECNFTVPEGGNYRVAASTENGVTFETESHGILLRKTYQWVPDQYYLTMKVSLENHTNQGLQGILGLESVSQQVAEEKKGFLSFLKRGSPPKDFVYQGSGKIERFRQKQGSLTQASSEFVGPVAWAGMESQYFLTALINRRLSSEQVLRMAQEGSVLKLALLPGHVVVSPNGRYDEDFTLYLGPKDRKHLELSGVGLEGAVDYGWFGVIAVPIAKLLQFFYGWVRNWGVAIIILTVFVKILTNPLAIKSLQQMKEMKKLQPEMQRLKEKFKEDKQRLNMEMMQLFKTHKVNPMGGCLPMFLQMPIYIALYKVLYNSIELYHAPFFGFYRDLSGPDPYFILPVLLGVFMVLQQKMTPQASVDPTQKEMMMIMPVMFTAFMLFLPVGLVLYILINTFMSVVQQYMSQREIRWRDLLSIKNF